MKALIVEDDAIAGKLLTAILDKSNWEADLATTGMAALALYARHNYNLIFMDLGLPDIDGLSLTRLMRNSQAKEYIPIIATTTQSEQQDHCFRAGIDLFLLKPLTCEAVTTALAKSTYAPLNKVPAATWQCAYKYGFAASH